LIDTVTANPTMSGSLSLYTSVIDAFSAILERAQSLPSTLVVDINVALGLLTSGIQDQMVQGMAVGHFATNLRLSTYSVSADSTSRLFIQSNDVEQYLELPNDFITLSSNSTDGNNNYTSTKVSLLQYNSNPHGVQTTSASVRVQVDSPNVYSILSTVQSLERISYRGSTAAAHTGIAYCTPSVSQLQYNMSVICPNGGDNSNNSSSYTVACDGIKSTEIKYTCPLNSFLPVCTVWNGSEYVSNPHCTVVSYSTTNITCLCSQFNLASFDSTTTTSQHGRKLVPTYANFHELSSSTKLVQSEFVTVIVSANNVSPSSASKNVTILVTMNVIILILFIGIFILVKIDLREAEAISKLQPRPIYRFSTLLKEAIPTDFESKKWYVRMWKRLCTEHSLIASLATSYNAENDYRVTQWLFLFGFIFNTILVDTIFAVLYLVDTGVCSSFSSSESSCLDQVSLDQQNTLCVWTSASSNSDSNCSFNSAIGESATSILVLSTLTLLLTIPLNLLLYIGIREIRKFFGSLYIQVSNLYF